MTSLAGARRRLLLVDALAADDVSRAVGVSAPVAVADRVLEAAVALRRARRPVPAVDADVRRPVADVEPATAFAVARAHVAKTHHVRQPFPWKPAHAHAREYDVPVAGSDGGRVTFWNHRV